MSMGKLGVSVASLILCLCLAAVLSYVAILYQTTSTRGFEHSKGSLPIITLSNPGSKCNCTFRVPALMPSQLRSGAEQADEAQDSSIHCACAEDHAAAEASRLSLIKDQMLQMLIRPPPASAATSCENSSRSGHGGAVGMTSSDGQGSTTVVRRNEPWYAEGRTWHYPVLFPRCSMDVCFDYSKCQGQEELLVYSYDQPSPPVRYFKLLNHTKWHTDDPEKACLYFVYLDLDKPHRPHPNALPYWNNGVNHVLITFADMWRQRGPPQESIGQASVMASDMHETIYRAAFDISIPLPGNVHMRELQGLGPEQRKYLLTFRGLRYLGRPGEEGVLRSHRAFRSMHNGQDIVVATSCRQATNDIVRRDSPELGASCDEDNALHARYSYYDLMNTTFGLVPAGRQPNSYRFVEVLSAGVVPVLIADNYVKPFDTLVQWHRCLLQFPSSQMHRIVPTIRAMPLPEIQRRQRYCLDVYNDFLKDDDTLVRAAIASLRARFLGTFPVQKR